MKGCILMVPNYFTTGSAPKYFSTSEILNAAIFKKVIPRNMGFEEALVGTLWAGFRYFASEHYGEGRSSASSGTSGSGRRIDTIPYLDEVAREIARQVSGKKASDVFSSCVEIIIDELSMYTGSVALGELHERTGFKADRALDL